MVLLGKATDWGFNKRVEKYIVDPIYKTSLKDLEKFNPELVFICVPTPMSNDGSQDSSIIEGVIEDLTKYAPDAVKGSKKYCAAINSWKTFINRPKSYI